MSKTIVIHHSADYDGVFCREIAREFMPYAELVGWDFGNPPVKPTRDYDQVFVLDLPCDKPLGIEADKLWPGCSNLVWIDHHKSAIESHPKDIPGYRIDGVAACRLAWQWFSKREIQDLPLDWKREMMPCKQDYVDRKVSEPLAVRLAGEYDVWTHHGDGDLEFQFGLDAQVGLDLQVLLSGSAGIDANTITRHIVDEGSSAMRCYAKRDADIVLERSFLLAWEGLEFLALNTARCNSNTFSARDHPETGHDALMGFYFNGSRWTVSMYHANHRKDLDLSLIAVKHGGGGHRGACGFTSEKFPF